MVREVVGKMLRLGGPLVRVRVRTRARWKWMARPAEPKGSCARGDQRVTVVTC